MTTKIQNIAMFAIAAFALSGMMTSPAFAAGETDVITLVATAEGDADQETQNNPNECGSGESIQSWAEVGNNDPNDYVKVIADATECSSHSNTQIIVKINGQVTATVNTSSDYHEVTFSEDIDENDSVYVKFTYLY